MNDEINLKEMSIDEILELMQEDLYDGLAEELVEEVQELHAVFVRHAAVVSRQAPAGAQFTVFVQA